VLARKVKDAHEERALIHFQKSSNPNLVIKAVADYFKISKNKQKKRESAYYFQSF